MSDETSVERFTACAHICHPQCSKQYLAVKASDYDALKAELAKALRIDPDMACDLCHPDGKRYLGDCAYCVLHARPGRLVTLNVVNVVLAAYYDALKAERDEARAALAEAKDEWMRQSAETAEGLDKVERLGIENASLRAELDALKTASPGFQGVRNE